jgi:endogenous inhibitor of DNA gyrase (YacG/DUF329 family)
VRLFTCSATRSKVNKRLKFCSKRIHRITFFYWPQERKPHKDKGRTWLARLARSSV